MEAASETAPEPKVAAYCRLFGSFMLENRQGPVRLRSRRSRALIAYLVLAGPSGAGRERLSGLLWSDRGEEQARASLRQCLLELRRELSDAGIEGLNAGREQVCLVPGALASDVEQLEDAIRRHDLAGLCASLQAIGSGLLLEDLSLGGLFDEWLQSTRARLDSAIEREVRRMIEAAEEGRAWNELRALAGAFLLRCPTDEVVAAAAIRADMAQGITSSAHRRFRALESTLASEFGLRPSSTVSRALTVVTDSAAAAAPQTPAAAGAQRLDHSPPIVVVGVFEGADFDPRSLLLAQTLRDEVVAGLARFRDLSVVIDPHPVASLDPHAFADPQLVFTLGARIRPGPRTGLTIQLTRLHTRAIAWSDTFEVPEAEILTATDSIVGRVVGAVLPSIDLDLARPVRDADSGSIYVDYLDASRLAKTAATFEEASRAAEDLRGIIAAHPNFVLPYLPLASLYNTDFNYTRAGVSDLARREEALTLAKTAMGIDRGHVHSYTIAAWCYLRGRNWDAAARLFEQALNLNPFNASRLKEIGFGLLFLDRREEARELLNRCLLINPAPEDHYFTDLGLLEWVCGATERASTYFELVARPSIWSTIYQAVTAEVGGHGPGEASRRARERIAAIWPRDREMSQAAIIDWMLVHNPFRAEEVQARFVAGVRMMLDPAASPPQPAPLGLP
jgi:DNA-binding SARP family transcriptional activator